MLHDDINILIILACRHVSLDTCKVTHIYCVCLLICLKEWEFQSVLCCSKTTWSWVFYKEGKKEAHSVAEIQACSWYWFLVRASRWITSRPEMCERSKSDGARMGQEGSRKARIGQALCSSLITWSCGTNWSLGDAAHPERPASMLSLLCLSWISLKFPRAPSTAPEAKLPASVLLGLGRHIPKLSKPCIWAVFLVLDWGVPHRME